MQQTISVNDLISVIAKLNNNKTITLEAGMNLYLNNVKLHNRPGTYSSYKECLTTIITFLESNGIKYTHELNGQHIELFMQRCKNRGNKSVTINKRIRALKTMLNYLEYQELITKPTLKYKPLLNEKPIIPRVDKNCINKILDYASTLNDNSHLMLLLLIGTGIRTNELVHIKQQNVDFKKHRILLDFTKNGQSRYIYISSEMETIINRIMTSTPGTYLFGNGDDHFQTSAVKSLIIRTKKALNMEVLSAHKLRHLYATVLYENKVPMPTIQRLLGHQSLEMTRIYLDIDDEQIQLENDLYNPIATYKNKKS